VIVPSSLPRACLHVTAGTGTKGRRDKRDTTTPRQRKKVITTALDPRPLKGTLGGSNRMLSSRDVAAILGIPERTVRDKWREWGLPAYRIGRHLRWKERDVYAWIDRQAA
jgi:excisionase family DNA binding protein